MVDWIARDVPSRAKLRRAVQLRSVVVYPFDVDRREHLVAGYARWLRTRDDADEWAWAALHDAIWWQGEPLEMLAIVVDVIDRVADDAEALQLLGAGPLEDLHGGD